MINLANLPINAVSTAARPLVPLAGAAAAGYFATDLIDTYIEHMKGKDPSWAASCMAYSLKGALPVVVFAALPCDPAGIAIRVGMATRVLFAVQGISPTQTIKNALAPMYYQLISKIPMSLYATTIYPILHKIEELLFGPKAARQLAESKDCGLKDLHFGVAVQAQKAEMISLHEVHGVSRKALKADGVSPFKAFRKMGQQMAKKAKMLEKQNTVPAEVPVVTEPKQTPAAVMPMKYERYNSQRGISQPAQWQGTQTTTYKPVQQKKASSLNTTSPVVKAKAQPYHKAAKTLVKFLKFV